jgi:hypothetical protein
VIKKLLKKYFFGREFFNSAVCIEFDEVKRIKRKNKKKSEKKLVCEN